MSHKNLDKYEELIGFQRIMYKLANERYLELLSSDSTTASVLGPHDIAKILYRDYYDLVYPKGYKEKHSEFKERNIKAIKKNVERHFNIINAHDVPSKYMYAYSKLFHVSMDYLFGNTGCYTDDIEAREICEKTGLSEKTVEHLLSNDEVFVFDDSIYDFSLPVAEDSEYESIRKFWDSALSSDLYSSLPEAFFHMASSSFFYKLVKADEEKLRTEKFVLPPKNEFVEIIDNYDNHSRGVYFPNGLSAAELYDTDKHWCESTLREIYNERYEDTRAQLQKLELAYWGCAGQFDRLVLNFFHEMADRYKIEFLNYEEEQ